MPNPCRHLGLVIAFTFIATVACSAENLPATSAPTVKFTPPAALLEYPRAGAETLQTLGVTQHLHHRVADVTLAAPAKDTAPIKAFLVQPDSPGPFAAVLWVHWLGERETTNRTQFLAEAEAFADAGVVSLLVDTMWAQPGWYRARKFERDRAASINQVIELRRALDVLLAQPGVDPKRIAIVAHDYGAMHCTILAGVDSRVHDYVFISGTPSLLDWAFYVGKPASMADYEADMHVVDLKEYLRLAGGGRFLLQYAEVDFYVPLPKALEYFTATPGEKQLVIYSGATHAMKEVPAIRENRAAWLRKALKLPAVN